MSALDWSRLAMATLTPQDYLVHNDGALYSPQMLKLFEGAMAQARREQSPESVDRGRDAQG